MGVVLARKDASVHPMEQVKTIVPTSKPYFSLFCSPCYHKRTKKPHAFSLPEGNCLRLPGLYHNVDSNNILELPKPLSLGKTSRKLSPIPSALIPNQKQITIDHHEVLDDVKAKTAENFLSRKDSENKQFYSENSRIPNSFLNREGLNKEKTVEQNNEKNNENLLEKSVQSSNSKIKTLQPKSSIQSLDNRVYFIVDKPIEKSLKTQDSPRLLEESIRMCPLPEFQVNNLTELINNNRFLVQENSLPEIQLRKIQSNFQKGNKLGKGPNGKVFECLNLDSGEILAVKAMNSSLIEPNNAFLFQQKFLELRHENLLGYLDFGYGKEEDNSNEIELVSEYIAGGSLKNLLAKFGKFEENVTSLFTAQILNGLRYLHEKNILHRNLKSTNCLVESNGTIKLSDYFLLPLSINNTYFVHGSAESFPDSDSEVLSQYSENVQTDPFDPRHWMSPETYFNKIFTEKSDIWSLGCIVFEMLVGQSLFNISINKNKTIEEYYQNVTMFFPDNLSDKTRDFLTMLLKSKPEERANLETLRTHKFLEIQGVEIFEEDLEDNHVSDKGSNIDKLGSVVSKSNFSVLASIVNYSLQESHHFNNNTKNLKKKGKTSIQKSGKGDRCSLKNIFKPGDWEKKVIEEKEMEKSIMGEDSFDDFNKKRMDYEQILRKEIEIESKNKKKNNDSIDFNAKKRMEYEQNLIRELEGKDDSMDLNAKKRMEFEQNLLKELEGKDSLVDLNVQN